MPRRLAWGVLALTTCVMMVPVRGLAGSPGQESLRLIERAPGLRAWLSEDEVDALRASSPVRVLPGKLAHGGFIDVTDLPEASPTVLPYGALNPTEPVLGREVEPRLELAVPARLSERIRRLTAFHNRYYKSESGVEAAQWIAEQFRALGRKRTDVTVELVSHSFPQPSVIARIQGAGPHAAERVVLGAHLDSTSSVGGGLTAARRAPGADDNASGVATLLEVFQILAETGYRPDATLEFMAFAAEEAGLRGSGEIAARYKAAGIPVRGMVQFDMTMYPGPVKRLQFIDDYVDPSLTRFLQRLMDVYVKAPWGTFGCGYGCSDHASFTRSGFASAFPFEAPEGSYSPHIHSQADTLEQLDMLFGTQFVKLGLAFAIEASGTPASP